MLVEEIMHEDVLTLPPTAPISKASEYVRDKSVRFIPILHKDGEVAGIVSDRDIRDVTPSTMSEGQHNAIMDETIDTIMTTPVITVHPLDFVEEIARVFYENEFSSLPVVKNGRFVGIITDKDMLKTLIQLTGTHVQSSHVEVKVLHKPGILPQVAAYFGKRKINITSLLIYPYKDDPHYKILVFRIQTMNPMPVIQDLRDAGYELMWPNDIQEPKI